MDILQLVSGLILLFFLPGYFLYQALFPEADAHELAVRIAMIPALSLATVPVAVYLSYYFFKIPISYTLCVTVCLLISALGFVIHTVRRRSGS